MRWMIPTLLLFLVAACSSNQSSIVAEQEPSTETTKPQGDRPHLTGIETKTISLDQAGSQSGISLARNIYFIFDGSGSMADEMGSECGDNQQFRNKLEGAQWAVETFLQKVPDDIQIGLLVFDNEGVREVVPLGTQNREAFMQAIKACRAGGGTPLARAMRYGTDQLINQYKKQLGYGEFRLVVVTDGIAKGIPNAAVYAMSYGFPVYAIGLCVGADHPLRRYAYSYRAANSFDDLAAGLEETLAELPSYDVQTFEEKP